MIVSNRPDKSIAAAANQPAYRYVFGPVPSRRLGRSLGIDLVPFKTCPYDCVYCQLGRTTHITAERTEYVPIEEVLTELARKLADGSPPPDYFSLSGSGEPTLHSRLGELIREIKRMTITPVAVLTNGGLLWRRDVQDDLMQADVVLPSLCAADCSQFQRVNRPTDEISFGQMVGGLESFRRRFPGEMWLEVFLVSGITSSEPEVRRIADICRRIRPARVQLNTIARPPADKHATGVSSEQMQALAALFDQPVDIVSESSPRDASLCLSSTRRVDDAEVLALLSRHPCTEQDLAAGLGIAPPEAARVLTQLVAKGLVHTAPANGRDYYALENSCTGSLPAA